jgi:CelD/BcsL family acetyltransferase involved in cellulose biosynthesis
MPKIRVISGSEFGDDLASIWRGIVETEPSLASPYFQPEFTRAVAKARNDVFIAIIEDAGQVVAFFPFQRGAMRMGRPVAGPLSDYHGVIASPTLILDASALIRASGLGSWTFDHCLESQLLFKPFHRVICESPVIDLTHGFESYSAERRAAGSKQIIKTEGLARKIEREIGPIRFTAHVSDPAVLEQCIEWKRSHYAEMKVNDVLGASWTRELLREILKSQSAGFAGMLSTLHVGDTLIAVHMGMRSRTVWHYWFPTFDREMAKFSPGIILLLRMAQAATGVGLSSIDLGKGSTMYKDRLATGGIKISEGSVEIPSVSTSLLQFRRASENWIRQSPFLTVAKIPGKLVKRAERWLRFR